ncbi:ATP-binding protein [Sulfitobacter sp. 1A15106]|jgi:signal transduction histidine kinase|uniref:ATP-binding protein n=2 Tax=unclassified Sulfitobacter TaxID=196795 RepID=UPI0037459896
MNTQAIRRLGVQMGRRLTKDARHLKIGLGGAVATLLLASIWIVVDARQDEQADVRTAATNISALLAQQGRTALESTDLALRAIADWLEREDLPQDDAEFRTFIRSLNERLETVRALFVIGADGYISHDTDYPDTPRVSLADRQYFSVLRDDPDRDFYVGRPILSRSVSRWFVPVARRLESTDGQFAGVAVAALEPNFIERTYGRLKLEPRDVVVLFHADRTLIASVPPLPDAYGTKAENVRIFAPDLAEASNGIYQTMNPLTEREAVVGFERFGAFPLVVAVGLDHGDALVDWRRTLWTVVLADILLIALMLLLYSALERRRLERQVERQKAAMQQKLETIGFMTSGVAHDFKNILAVIDSAVRLLRRRDADETLLRGIDEARERGVGLISDLLQFAKDQEVHTSTFSLDGQIRSLEALLRRSTGSGVTLSLDLQAGEACVEASRALLDAALMNLAVNASHAMSKGGELVISTRVVDLEEHPKLHPGRYVSIQVEDTGQGISQETLASLFQPFTSTKGTHGTGLGLYQTRRFAREAGGDIGVTSELDHGTRVQILLPVADSSSP